MEPTGKGIKWARNSRKEWLAGSRKASLVILSSWRRNFSLHYIRLRVHTALCLQEALLFPLPNYFRLMRCFSNNLPGHTNGTGPKTVLHKPLKKTLPANAGAQGTCEGQATRSSGQRRAGEQLDSRLPQEIGLTVQNITRAWLSLSSVTQDPRST